MTNNITNSVLSMCGSCPWSWSYVKQHPSSERKFEIVDGFSHHGLASQDDKVVQVDISTRFEQKVL